MNETERKRRLMELILVIAMCVTIILLMTLLSLLSEKMQARIRKENQVQRQLNFEQESITANLNLIEKTLNDTNTMINEGCNALLQNAPSTQETLNLIYSKIDKIENELLVKLGNSEENQMRPIYEETSLELSEIIELLTTVDNDVVSIGEEKARITSYIPFVCNKAKEDLANLKERIDSLSEDSTELTEKYEKYNQLCEYIDSLYKKVDEYSLNTNNQLSLMNEKATSAYETSERIRVKLNDFLLIIEENESKIAEQEAYEAIEASLIKKLNSMDITLSMNMGQPIGFTEEELRLLLEKVGLVKDQRILDTLPAVMVETVKEYPVNELCSIAVMSLESGHFKSDLAVNNNNFGGMLVKGVGMKFSSVEEGLAAAIRCLYKNLKGNNTLHDINKSYCPPSQPGDYHWSDKVLNIMQRYKTAATKS